jgi:hydroxylaminobenzene mutase
MAKTLRRRERGPRAGLPLNIVCWAQHRLDLASSDITMESGMNVHSGSRQLLIHGMVLVLVGLVWGLVVPSTPHPRLALGAHIQLVSNGMLFIIQATCLLALPHSVGAKSIRVMVVAAWLTWTMALSEAANSWWGTIQPLSIAASQAGAIGGESWQELILKLTHISAGLGLIIAWFLLVVGFLKHAPDAESNDA